MCASLKKHGSALKSSKPTNYMSLDRISLNLDFDISFAKIS